MKWLFLLIPFSVIYLNSCQPRFIKLPVKSALPDTTGERYAEVVLAGKNNGVIDKWDILQVLNSSRNMKRFLHDHINPDSVSRTLGYVDLDDFSYDHFLKTKQYRFERISTDSLRRINQFTSVVDTVSDTPNNNGEYIDVPLFFQRRLLNSKHMIFGSNNNEVFFGGSTRSDYDTLSVLVDSLISKKSLPSSASRKARRKTKEWNQGQKKKFVIIRCYDVSDTLATSLIDTLDGSYLYEITPQSMAAESPLSVGDINSAIASDADIRCLYVFDFEAIRELK